MSPIFLDRETLESFWADSLDQAARLTVEDIGRAPPEPAGPSRAMPAPEPVIEPVIDTPQPQPSAVPDFDTFAASVLGPTPTVAPARAPAPSPTPAPTPAAAPARAVSPSAATSPPPLENLLRSAGLADIGQPFSDLGTTARRAADTAGGLRLEDLMSAAGMQQPSPIPQVGVGAPRQAPPSLPHNEEPATATDTRGGDLGGKWKTSFDWGSTYTGDYRTGTPHRGIDLVPHQGGIGTSVEAFTPGTVTNIQRDSGAGGLMVYVQDDQGLTHTYMHLAGTAPGLAVGQTVARGQPIAQMGESGTEGSPHLHYEVRKNAASGDPTDQLIDPRPYMGGGAPTGTALPATAGGRVGPRLAQSTAEMSGGAPSGGLNERASWIMGEGAKAADWLGGHGQRALQAILVTEGGMNNARGDGGQSAGPLQFFAGGGQLNNLMRDLGMNAEQAMRWAEENPIAAIQWAIGTPDKPGYLGRAIANGLQQGLQGGDLAEHAQKTGQVSVSPERAKANYQALFGGGGSLVASASAPAIGGADYGALSSSGAALAQQGATLAAGMQPGEPVESAFDARRRQIQQDIAQLNADQAKVDEERRQGSTQSSIDAAEAARAETQQSALAQQLAPPEPAKPVWQSIGDTIGSSIAQGLQPIIEMFQTQAAPVARQVGETAKTVAETEVPGFRGLVEGAVAVPGNLGQGIIQGAIGVGEPLNQTGRGIEDVMSDVGVPIQEAAASPGGRAVGGAFEELGRQVGPYAEQVTRAIAAGAPYNPAVGMVRNAADAVSLAMDLTGGRSERFPSGGPLKPLAGIQRVEIGQQQQGRDFEAETGVAYPAFEQMVGNEARAIAMGEQQDFSPEVQRLREVWSRHGSTPRALEAYARAPAEIADLMETQADIAGGIASTALVPGSVALRPASLARAAAASFIDPLSAPFFGAEAAGRVAGRLGKPAATAAGIIEPEARAGMQAGGLGTPRYPWEAGTPEAGVANGLRTAAAADPQGVAHLTSEEMAGLPGMPRQSGEGVPKWQEGFATSLDDLRVAADNGMDQATWYSKFADGAAKLVGRENINEFRTLFGITSQQTAPVENLAYTLGLMRMSREFEENGTQFTAKNIQAWTKQNPIHLGGTEGWTEKQIASWIKGSKGNGSVVDGQRYGGWGVGGAQFKKVADLYNNGAVKVATNAKTPSYSQNILSALENLFDPNSTMDTWMAQVFNFANSKMVANSDAAFRSMREVVSHLAGELGMNPHQVQAAMWFSIKAAKDFARTKAAPAAYKALVKDFTKGKATLNEVIEEARKLGVYSPERLTGTWEETLTAPQVAHQAELLRGAIGKPRPQIADNAHLAYPGRSKKLGHPVGPELTAQRRAFAEAGSPAVSTGRIPEQALEELGYDPARGQFSSISTIPHKVTETASGHQIMLPGGNVETGQYVGSIVGRASGAEEVAIKVFEPTSPDLHGWALGNATDGGALDAETAQRMRDMLDAHDLQYSEPVNGIIRVHALDAADPAYEQGLAEALAAVPGVKTLDLKGVSQHVGAAEYQTNIERLQPRYGAAGPSRVPEPGGRVGEPGLPARPPGVAPGGAPGAGTALRLESAAAVQPGVGGLAAGPSRGGLHPSGGARGAELPGAAELPERPPGAEATELRAGAAGGAPDPLTGSQGDLTQRFDQAAVPKAPYAVGEDVTMPDGNVAQRVTTWDSDEIVRERYLAKQKPQTHNLFSKLEADGETRTWEPRRAALHEGWIDKLYEDGRALAGGEYAKDRRLDIITGLPAVGKSTIYANPIVKKFRAFLADNDLAKEIIPEFDQGLGAGLVHEESSILGETVLERAMKNGDNIVLPIVGGKQKKLDKLLNQFEAAGYQVYIHNLDAHPEMSMQNTVKRFGVKEPPADKGRLVLPEVVLDSLGDSGDGPRVAFEGFVTQHGDRLAGWSRVKNEPGFKLTMVADHNSNLPDEVMSRMHTMADGSPGPKHPSRAGELPIAPPRAGLLSERAPPGALRQVGGRAGLGSAAGASAAAQEEGAEPGDILRGGAQGAFLTGARGALARAGIRGPIVRTGARVAGLVEDVAEPRLTGVREAIAESPAGDVLGALRGPALLDDAELLAQATPREREIATRGARLATGGAEPTEADIADILRGERIGEAYAGERGTAGGKKPPPNAPQPPAGAVPNRNFDLDYLADLRRQERGSQPPLFEARTKTGRADQVVAVTIANMLSGMGSAVQNTIGGVVNNAYRPLETFASGRPSDAMRDVAAQFNSLGEAFSKYGHTFMTGERSLQAGTESTTTIVGGMKNPLNWVLRNLAATDEFMGALATAGEQSAEVSRLMRVNPKLTFEEVVQGNRGAIIDAGTRARKEATFSEGGGPLGTLGAKMASWREGMLASENNGEKAVGLVFQWLVPMSRVPGVILGKGIRSVPVINEVTGAIEFVNLARQGRHAEARRAVSKTALTSVANIAILDQVIKGNITGNGPESDEERARLMEAVDANGNAVWRPNSIRIGDRWFDHSGLGPISFSMGSIANAVDEANEISLKPASERGDAPQWAGAVLKRQAQTVSQAWFLKNTADILSAIKDGNVAAIATQVATGGDRLIPLGGLANEIRRIEDPITREPSKELGRNLIEREANRLPFASRMVPPRLAATTGQPMEAPRDIFSTLVRGTPGGMMTPNPVAEEIARLNETGSNVSAPREDEMFKGARQSTEQTRKIQQDVGQAINQYVLDTMQKPQYAGLNDKQKADALNSAVGQARAAANITLSGQVARSPKESALLQWSQTPQYQGVSSTQAPEEIARENWEIAQAKSKLADYTKQYGSQAANKLRKDDPAAAKLAQRSKISETTLARKKKKIDEASGGALSQAEKEAAAGGLVGVGSTTLPATPPRR